MSARINTVIYDASNVAFDPDSCSHIYSYDTTGNMLTDQCTDSSGLTRTKTYTYTTVNDVSLIASETRWIQQ
jgi:hypothetical protein